MQLNVHSSFFAIAVFICTLNYDCKIENNVTFHKLFNGDKIFIEEWDDIRAWMELCRDEDEDDAIATP